MKPLIKLLMAVMVVSLTNAAVFFVDPNVPEGTRAKAAGSITAPYGTIQQAADLVKAGDRIILRDGHYFQDAVITASGTPDNKVVIRAENLKQAVICGKLVIKGDYVRVEGLHIDGGARWSDVPRAKAAATQAVTGVLELEGTHADIIGQTFSDVSTSRPALSCSPGTRVANCLFIRNNQNLGTSSDCIIENNEFTDMRGTNTDNIRLFGIKVIVRHNYIHGTLFKNTADSHVDCFQAFDNNDAKSQDILVDGNWCFGDYHQGVMLENDAMHSDNIKNWYVRNNVFCNFTAMAITAGKGHGIPNCNVYNNIFINANPTSRCVIMNGPTGTGKVWNNIFFFIRSNSMYTENGAQMDARNNMLYLSTGAGGGVTPVNNIIADPKMNMPSNTLVSMYDGSTRTWSKYFNKDNFPTGLSGDSPCIDAGVDASGVTCWADTGPFSKDINKVSRPQHSGFDVGPFEYDGALEVSDEPNVKGNGNVTLINPVREKAVFRLGGSAAVGNVWLKVYDGVGRQVAEVWDLTNKQVTWNTGDAQPGMYFYEVRTGARQYTGSIMVVK